MEHSRNFRQGRSRKNQHTKNQSSAQPNSQNSVQSSVTRGTDQNQQTRNAGDGQRRNPRTSQNRQQRSSDQSQQQPRQNQRAPERITERAPERTQERTQERTLERTPERTPERTYQGSAVPAQARQNQTNQGQRQAQKQQNTVYETPTVKPALPVYTCPRCSQPITEISSALADKESGVPVHFDCVIDILKERENIKPNERITYIGQGRFAVIYFENPHDLRKFSILRVIEWEQREKKFDWRLEVADCYSQVK